MQFEKPHPTDQEARAIHSGWADARKRVATALKAAGVPTARLDRFLSCGSLAWIAKNTETGRVRVQCTRCHDRFCRTCADQRRKAQIKRLLDLVQGDGRTVRLLTLTLRHESQPLATQLDRLYECYRRFRQRRAWTDHVSAAAAAVEITQDAHGGWHVHMHVLCVGLFWLQRDISTEWLAATGNSYVVDVRALPAKRAVAYAAKYIGKCTNAGVEQRTASLVEAIKALRGKRTLIISGEWYGKLAEEPDQNPGKGKWEAVMSVEQCIKLAASGDLDAQELLEKLKLNWKDLANESTIRRTLRVESG